MKKRPLAGKIMLRPGSTSEGCLLCGQPLKYSQMPKIGTCEICGQTQETKTACVAGHFICDSCHAGSIMDHVAALLAVSRETDPVNLAMRIFELNGLNMHGPEYHSIVPAVLVTAWQNAYQMRDQSKIDEAIRRGQQVPGGSCGLAGNCGAGVGAGVASAIISESTPLTGPERQQALQATGQALMAIGQFAGARCCKRDAIVSIETFVKSTPYFKQAEPLANYICKQFAQNKTCLGTKCPYFPTRLKILDNRKD